MLLLNWDETAAEISLAELQPRLQHLRQPRPPAPAAAGTPAARPPPETVAATATGLDTAGPVLADGPTQDDLDDINTD